LAIREIEAESEAKQSGPRKEAVGARARSGRGFKWRGPVAGGA